MAAASRRSPRFTPPMDRLETPKSLKKQPPEPSRRTRTRRSLTFSPTITDLQETSNTAKKRSTSTPKSLPLTRKTLNVEESKTKKRARHNIDLGKIDNSFSKVLKQRRVYYKKVVFDGEEFEVGDDVYVKRREGVESDGDEPEIEECRICFKEGGTVMVECDNCLGGFHLKCLKPPLKKVPEGDWSCPYCEAMKAGKEVEMPKLPPGKKNRRTAKEKLLASDLWAARIERLWKEADGRYMLRCRWYLIPEETAAGRQQHNLRRELYRTNDFSDIEMETILRRCSVMNPKDFAEASNDGDDVFYCEYEYDIHRHSFKRISDMDIDEENGGDAEIDWKACKDSVSSADEDSEYEDDVETLAENVRSHEVAVNSHKGRIFGLQRIGIKKIPQHVRCRKQTEMERAKAALMLATLPKSPPCRNKEMEEITAFVKGAVCDDQCLGRCLYIHGVPGTGKTMCVRAVMKTLRSEVDSGSLNPYTFVEVNGLKLASPENIYKVIYEAISGHRVGWKKALHYLNERFSEKSRVGSAENQPCVLLIDELDLLLTRNQSVLYNILDWPTKPCAKLVVIGIANTMDLPEKLLPRISSRMGIQRLCFGPYNFKQLQEIISSRLEGIDAFEDQAIEFASRKVAAMSGDARRALEICRRASELVDYQLKHISQSKSNGTSQSGKLLVGMDDIEAAIQEVFQAPHIRFIRSGSKVSKIILVALVHELNRSGLDVITCEQLAESVFSLCSSNMEEFPGWDTLRRVVCNLGESRVILCEEGAKRRMQKMQLNFPRIVQRFRGCPSICNLSLEGHENPVICGVLYPIMSKDEVVLLRLAL